MFRLYVFMPMAFMSIKQAQKLPSAGLINRHDATHRRIYHPRRRSILSLGLIRGLHPLTFYIHNRSMADVDQLEAIRIRE